MENNIDYSKFLNHKPEVQGFFDERTNTISYVVADPNSKQCAVIDSVMDYEPNGATLFFENADAIIEFVTGKGYKVEWILETHVHADHLSAAPYLKEKLGGTMAIGKYIVDVQNIFGKVFNEGTEFQRDGSQFDQLWNDGDTFFLGEIPAKVIHTPGHTPADMVYVIGDAVFAGDTMFMPDFGTARCDFPGGNAEIMYESTQKIFALPESMRMFMCHDYLPEGRTEYIWETTIGEQKKQNIHIKEGVEKDRFKKMREERDAQLGMPKLIIPSIQVNMRGGNLPLPDESGTVQLKTPVNSVFSKKGS
ncbi:MBL fold metallo-hydrolase [Candidatus Nomurabacteria bacterium]|nr:MBL fold metallo-hydrolase [Candidatus Nomurabacteria bacterium]